MLQLQRSFWAVLLVVGGLLPLQVLAKDDVEANFAVTVSAELEQDEVRLVFSAQVQAQTASDVNESLAIAIKKARQSIGSSDVVKVSTGGFRTFPFYDSKDNRLLAWRGQADLVLSSNDLVAAGHIADKLVGQLALSNISFSLSDQRRRAEQSRLLDEAAQAFQAKAQATAKAFGFLDYRIDKLKISESGESFSPRPLMMARASSDSAQDSSLNLQPGRQKVSVTVSGSIRMR